VLVFTASVGAGHDVPAAHLERAIRARGGEVEIVDALAAVGGAMRRAAHRADRVFELQHLLFARTPPLRALGQSGLHRFAGPRLLAEVERHRADVVVSVYPGSTEGLAWLRRTGRLRVPVVAAITDLASLRYWAARGADLHLVTHPESLPEVERIAGHGPAFAVRGLYDERFLDPPPRAPGTSPVIAVSGGGWGVGDIEGAVEIACETDGAAVVALCGHNEALRERTVERFPDVRTLPFVADMPAVLAGADVLVHSSAGLTVLEALLVGCSPISYGWGVGHVRANNRAYRHLGLARVAASRDALRTAIAEALAEPRVPLGPAYSKLPHAADLVLELTR
jgi:UDP-N-acetylglucosamine:LPS N-acetylglucosamine transferase